MAAVKGSGSFGSLGIKLAVAAVAGASAFVAAPAHAQDMPAPIVRSQGWKDATNILTLSSIGVQLLMPRVFYSDPEVTVGWKARWHASVLAPSMTLVATGLINEQFLKDTFKGYRPGCNEMNAGYNRDGVNCKDAYGMLSTHSYLAGSALGQGLGVFLVDTVKWSNGRINGGSLAMNVGVPAALGVITTIGRSAGNWETGGQAWGSAAIGLAIGMGLGALYATAQRPECGYGGDLICW
jgi:hypothetical protein